MIAALTYLQFHSVKNNLVLRVKRLKQPKYLFGALAGGAVVFGTKTEWLVRAGVTGLA